MQSNYGYEAVDGWFYSWITTRYQNQERRIREFMVRHGKGSGFFDTIQRAIDYAEEGDRVAIQHGTYIESLNISKFVELHADGEDVVIEHRGEVTIAVKSPNGCDLRGLSIRNKGQLGCAVVVFEGQARLQDCFVQGVEAQGHGSHAAHVHLRKCTLSNSPRHGLHIRMGASAVVDACEIKENGEASVYISSVGKVELTGCTIYQSACNTLIVAGGEIGEEETQAPLEEGKWRQVSPTFYACRIEDKYLGVQGKDPRETEKTPHVPLDIHSKCLKTDDLSLDRAAVISSNEAAPVFERCTISSRMGFGVSIRGSPAVFRESCVIRSCGRFGVQVLPDDRGVVVPHIESCKIEDNVRGGIVLAPGTSATRTTKASISNTFIEANGGPGLLVCGPFCDPKIERNTIRDHRSNPTTVGVAVIDQASGTFERNKIQNNLLGMTIETGADPSFEYDEFYDNDCAISVDRYGKGRFTTCRVAKCGLRGAFAVRVQRGGHPTFEETVFTKNGPPVPKANVSLSKLESSEDPGGGTILVDSGGRGMFTKNVISDGESSIAPQVLVRGRGNPLFHENEIIGGTQHGVLVTSGGLGTFRLNKIVGHSHDNVVISDGADPVFTKNEVRAAAGCGFLIQDALGVVKENTVSENALAGIKIELEANPVVRRNVVRRQHFGIVVSAGGKGEVVKNTATGNGVNFEVDGRIDPSTHPSPGLVVTNPRIIANNFGSASPMHSTKTMPLQGGLCAWIHDHAGDDTGAGGMLFMRNSLIDDPGSLSRALMLVEKRGGGNFVRNVFRGAGKGTGIIVALKGMGRFSENKIEGAYADAAVCIQTASQPLFVNNDITSTKQGVLSQGKGQGRVLQNKIHSCGGAGIAIIQEGATTFEDNVVTANGGGGVLLTDGGLGELTKNRIFRNIGVGVVVKEQANPKLVENEIFEEDIGIYVQRRGYGVIQQNDIHGCRECNVRLGELGDPDFSRNTLRHAKYGFVMSEPQAEGNLQENYIFGCTEAGALVCNGANPRFFRNVFGGEEGNKVAVLVTDGGFGMFIENQFVGNTVGLKIEKEGNPDVKLNIFDGAEVKLKVHAGILVLEKGKGHIWNGNRFSRFAKDSAAIEVRGTCDPLMEGNTIEKCTTGARFMSGGLGTFRDNNVKANTRAGIEVLDGADPKIEGNLIHSNVKDGGLVHHGGAGKWSGNRFVKNAESSLRIETNGNPQVVECQFQGAGDDTTDPGEVGPVGILVENKGKGTIKECKFVGHAKTAVNVLTQGSPEVVKCHIQKHDYAGVTIEDGGLGRFTGNQIHANRNGVYIRGAGSNPVVTENTISENDAGVRVVDSGTGVVERNVIHNNVSYGVGTKGLGNPSVSENSIKFNAKHGVMADYRGGGRFTRNEIEGNGEAGVLIVGGARPVVQHNQITRNGPVAANVEGDFGGVVASEQGSGEVARNLIDANRPSNVVLTTRSTTEVKGNIIQGSSGWGIVLRGSASSAISLNRFRENKLGAVLVQSSSEPTVSQNVLEGGAGVAFLVVVEESGKGMFSGNYISGAGTAGVVLQSGACAVVSGNTITENKEGEDTAGILLHPGSDGEVRSNCVHGNSIGVVLHVDPNASEWDITPCTTQVHDNDFTGNVINVSIDGGMLDLKRNRITRGKVCGVRVLGGEINLTENSVVANRVGIDISGGTAGVTDNKICLNVDGVCLRGPVGKRTLLIGNDIAGNDRVGVHFQSAAAGYVKGRNKIYHNGERDRESGCGVLVEGSNGTALEDREAQMEDNVVSSQRVGMLCRQVTSFTTSQLAILHCTEAGIRVVGTPSVPTVLRCDVYDNAGSGIELLEGAGGTFEHCNVVENFGAGIMVGRDTPAEKAALRLKGCHLYFPSQAGLCSAVVLDRAAKISLNEAAPSHEHNVVRNDMRFSGPWNCLFQGQVSQRMGAHQAMASRRDAWEREVKHQLEVLEDAKKTKRTAQQLEKASQSRSEQIQVAVQEAVQEVEAFLSLINFDLDHAQAMKLAMDGALREIPAPEPDRNSPMPTKSPSGDMTKKPPSSPSPKNIGRPGSESRKSMRQSSGPSKRPSTRSARKEGVSPSRRPSKPEAEEPPVESTPSPPLVRQLYYSSAQMNEGAARLLQFLRSCPDILVKTPQEILSAEPLREAELMPTLGKHIASSNIFLAHLSVDHLGKDSPLREEVAYAAMVEQHQRKRKSKQAPSLRLIFVVNDITKLKILRAKAAGGDESKGSWLDKVLARHKFLYMPKDPTKLEEMLKDLGSILLGDADDLPPIYAKWEEARSKQHAVRPLSPSLAKTSSPSDFALPALNTSLRSPSTTPTPKTPPVRTPQKSPPLPLVPVEDKTLFPSPKVFVCCSSIDQAQVGVLTRNITLEDPRFHGAFYCWEGQKSGREYNNFLRQAFDEDTVMLWVVTSNFAVSRQAAKEYDRMRFCHSKIRPCLTVEVDTISVPQPESWQSSMLRHLNQARSGESYHQITGDWFDPSVIKSIIAGLEKLLAKQNFTLPPSSTRQHTSHGMTSVSYSSRHDRSKKKHKENTSPLSRWTIDDVLGWISSTMNLPQYETGIRESRLTGIRLERADADTLQKAGVCDPDDRQAILEGVQALKREQSKADSAVKADES